MALMAAPPVENRTAADISSSQLAARERGTESTRVSRPAGAVVSVAPAAYSRSSGYATDDSYDILAAAHITELELKRELALTLFQQERLTLARASSLAGMSQREFQRLLAERRIPIHYGVEEFKQDLETLRQMGRL